MAAPTVHLRFVLARAGVRESALMHLSSERNTGALNPMCGANPVRSNEIRTWTTVPADLSALCADCASIVLGHPDVVSVEQGLATWLGAAAEATVRLLEVDPSSVRVSIDARIADEGLVASVATDGVLVPILARRTVHGLVAVDGGRRLDAAIRAHLESVPVVVRDLDEEGATVVPLLANLHRKDLDPIAQANAYVHALEVLGGTITDLADRLHLDRSTVSNVIRLLDLPTDLQAHVASGALSAAHGRALLRLPEGSEQQRALAEQILAEGLSSKAADAAARAATTMPAVRQIDVQRLLAIALEQAGLTGPKVQITTTADRARVVLDVADSDLPRVLAQLEHLGTIATPVA